MAYEVCMDKFINLLYDNINPLLDMERLMEAKVIMSIKNGRELEFAIFCIENVAIALGRETQEVYRLLTKDSDILYSYIIPEYEMLHTQSKEYIVRDIIEVMRESGGIE